MITFVGGNPFSTSFASRHSWRVRQSYNYDDYQSIDDDDDDEDDDNDEGDDDDDEDDGDDHDNKAIIGGSGSLKMTIMIY